MDKLIVTTPCFEHGGLIPVNCTGYGADKSPELHLSGLSENVVSIAVIMNDMGHPIPNYNHWVIWNIPVTTVIPGNIPSGKQVEQLKPAMQGIGYGKHRYKGPKPPFNWSHIYQFNVYALDCFLNLPNTAKRKTLLEALQGHVIQDAALIGHYR